MAKQTVNRGTTANDGTGEGLFDAFGKVNDNFSELYNLLAQNPDSATPLAGVWTLQSAATGNSNVAGADFAWSLSSSTGSGVAGRLAVKSSFAGKGAASATVTLTIASPCVVTHSAHGFVTGQPVVLTTTGALPTGLTAGATYYAIAVAGSTTTYRLATSVANAEAGTAINTSGTQSGVHTATTSATVQNPDITALTLGPSGLTGSQAISLLDLKQTWNTSGTPTGLKLSVVEVAANAAALFLDFQRSGTSRFKVDRNGHITITSEGFSPDVITMSHSGGAGQTAINSGTGGWVGFDTGGVVRLSGIGFGSARGVSSDVFAMRDAAQVWARRNGTTAQIDRFYRTYTDASNYERLALQSGAGYFEMAAETAGTGTDDLDLRLTPAGAGKVQFGAHSAVAAEVVTGYITIKDASGATRKLAVIS